MEDNRNPYAPPVADVADPRFVRTPQGALIPNGRLVPIGNGARWLNDAMRMFFDKPGKWIAVLLLLAVLLIALSLVPYVNLISTPLWPVLGGGLMYAVDMQRQTGSFTVGHVFAGFGPRFVPLFVIGVAALLTYPVLYLCLMLLVGTDVANLMVFGIGSTLDPARLMNLNFTLAMLIYMLVALPIVAATYLAPAFVMLHEEKPGAAMKMSFIGTLKNFIPGIVFGLLAALMLLVAIIPLGLGLLAALPILMISSYTMYRDIFVAEG